MEMFYLSGTEYAVKLPCAFLQTGHLETVHAPVADTRTYFASLDAPVVDMGHILGEITELGFENH